MGGWDATGFRVYLGTSESYEYGNEIVYAGEIVISVTPKKRLITVERAEYRGLTSAGATSKTATSGWTITSRDRSDESNQYKVIEEKKTEGSWTAV